MRLEASDVSYRYSRSAPNVLSSVSLSVGLGERLGIVGPSGYGKTTLLKILAGYIQPTEGIVTLGGKSLPRRGPSPIQLIGQHPEQSIDPRWRMRKVLEEAGQLRPEVLEAFGIEEGWLSRFPRELSGGEMQRFSVARALYSGTRFLLADEITTMLDVNTQAQIWHQVLEQVEQRNIGLIVVTHNRHLASRVCTRITDLRDVNLEPQQAKHSHEDVRAAQPENVGRGGEHSRTRP